VYKAFHNTLAIIQFSMQIVQSVNFSVDKLTC